MEWTGRSDNGFLVALAAGERAVRELSPNIAAVAVLMIATAAADPGQAYDFVSRVCAALQYRAVARSCLLVLATLALLAGCGGGGSKRSAGSSDYSAAAANGAKVFSSAGCGTCHTLQAAGSKGQIGGNLDKLKPSYSTVVRQVTNGGVSMPSFAGKLSKSQISNVAAFVSQSTRFTIAAVPIFHPNHVTIASCHGNYDCYKQAFGNIAYYQGPERALAELAREMRVNQTINGGCHQIAHEIGHAGYERYHHNAAEVLAHGGMTCWSGYYHGVIERAFGGVPHSKVAAVARTLCTGPEIDKTSFLLYQCVHGLGHGLMIYSGDDLPWALKVCDHLPTRWDQSSCTGGVFMQNFLPGPMALVKTAYERKNDLLYPCDAVSERHKLYCYLMVTSRILPAVSYNWKKAAYWCRRSDKGWVATCFQSMGRDASGYTQQNGRRILSICKVAGSMERECIYGGARDITANDASAARSTRFCAIVPKSIKSYCYFGIGTILGGFANEAAARRAKCDVVPLAYRRDCYRGANA